MECLESISTTETASILSEAKRSHILSVILLNYIQINYMQEQDFKIIADAFIGVKQHTNTNDTLLVNSIARHFANVFENKYPSFKKDEFLKDVIAS